MTPELRNAIANKGNPPAPTVLSGLLGRFDEALNTIIDIDALLAVVAASRADVDIVDAEQRAHVILRAQALLPGLVTSVQALFDAARKTEGAP